MFLQDLLLRELRIEPSDKSLAPRARTYRLGHPASARPADEAADFSLLTIRAAVYENNDRLVRMDQTEKAVRVGVARYVESPDDVPVAEPEIVIDHRGLHPPVPKPEDIEGLRLADMLTGMC